MWNKLSIKWQLILFITLIVTLVEASTLFTLFKIQNKQSRDSAIAHVDALSKSLNNDFLKVILNPTTDSFADISYRVSAFKDVNGVLLLDDTKQTVFKYASVERIQKLEKRIEKEKILFQNNTLLTIKELSMDDYIYGYILIDTDLSLHLQRQEEILISLLNIFPIALLLGFIITLFLGESYTKPYRELLNSMRKSNPTDNKIFLAKTSAKNEVKELFDGYNQLMKQVSNSAKELHYQAEHDQLTGIKNRFFLEKELQKALQNSEEVIYNLLAISLDGFNLLHDTEGYQEGDKFLKIIVENYAPSLPKEALFARVDGNKFLVLFKSSKESGLKLLQNSLELLKDCRYSSNENSYSVSASIGFISFKPFEYTLTELIKNVNSALQLAQLHGKDRSYIFNPEDIIAQRFNKELETETFIKEALTGEGPSKFELFAQAIVPLQYESEQFSYEILIRMWDRENNFVPPDNFLPTAARYQQMHEIDIWVLWSYLETVTQNPQHLKNLHSAHINLAGSSLTHPEFQAKVKEAVVHFNFPWSKLELEVTETSAVGNFKQANEFILWLKNVGIGLALDDFGTGMASFEYLKSMPFDVVKIDGSFVKDMHKDPIDKAVIKYIHEITELKGQETVAEYVETQEDVDTLREIGITYGQGYFLGKPKPLSDWL